MPIRKLQGWVVYDKYILAIRRHDILANFSAARDDEDTAAADQPSTEPDSYDTDDSPPASSDLPSVTPVRAKSHLRYLTLATMIKNQRRWLREWLEFNFMLGVEHIIIYDNESTDLPLEILQPYINMNLITYIPWPPPSVPPPQLPFSNSLEQWQYIWFKDALETCLSDSWTIHKQGPCQLAAFADAIARCKGGVSRWLGIWDVDEYIFPRFSSPYRKLSTLLHREFGDTDHIQVYGNVFGTSGYSERAAQRKPGSNLQALMTEEYTYRAESDRTDRTNLG